MVAFKSAPLVQRSRRWNLLGARRGARGTSLLLKVGVVFAATWCCLQFLPEGEQQQEREEGAFVAPAAARPAAAAASAGAASAAAALKGRRSATVLERDAVAVKEKEQEGVRNVPDETGTPFGGEGGEEEDAADEGSPEQRDQRVRSLGLALLQSAGKAEELFENDETPVRADGTLHLAEFRQLLDNLGLSCSSSDARSLFEKLRPEASSGIAAAGFKDTVRNGPVIAEMYSESLSNVGLTVVLSLAVAGAIVVFKGMPAGFDFLSAYVVEDSLSVDNLFVFLTLFKYFKVPPALQNYCLSLGIYGAVILRAIFIFGGLAAVQSFRPLLLGFAGFLIFASYKGLTEEEDDDDDEEDDKPAGPIMEILGRLPTTPEFHGDQLFVQKSGQWLATPLALCIIAVELSDILFAVDSIPAVFAVSSDPLIVYTSNIAAILGLRSLYQVLAVAAEDLVYLEKSVAIVLGFIGVKLTAEVAGFEISSVASLVVILGVLGTGIFLSLEEQKKEVESSESTVA